MWHKTRVQPIESLSSILIAGALLAIDLVPSGVMSLFLHHST